MDLNEAMHERHSVRSYMDEPLSAAERELIEGEIARCNAEGELHLQLVCDEPEAFSSTMARYGKFSGVKNYIVLAGPDAPDLEERCGYYGERIALIAQQNGLNTCWVALTFKKRLVKKMVAAGDKLVLVIAIGHGTTAGGAHKSKPLAEVSTMTGDGAAPAWFTAGVEAALLAPTAMNQQKFRFELTGKTGAGGKPVVAASTAGGPYTKADLGIARYHFELGAGVGNFAWA